MFMVFWEVGLWASGIARLSTARGETRLGPVLNGAPEGWSPRDWLRIKFRTQTVNVFISSWRRFLLGGNGKGCLNYAIVQVKQAATWKKEAEARKPTDEAAGYVVQVSFALL